MRPLVLQLENFTSFRTRQKLDLADSDLFAIAGPTGSGKSSLLDALVFALYGRVPRMGKSCAEMISLGRDRMAVSLDFRCGEGHYRVTRVLRRTGRTEAQLERVLEGGAAPLADGVRKVDDEIQRVLGLGYDAFTQAVILPQGEFARFLKSDPAQRQKILRDLLRLQVYEKMRKAAGEEAARLDQQVRSWETVLQTEYGAATPEAIQTLDEERTALADRNARLAAAMATAEAALLDLRRRRALTAALDEARQRLLELQAEAAAIRDLEARLHAGRRAAGVVPRLDAADTASAVATRAAAEAGESARAAAAAIQTHDESARTLAEALGAADETAALDQRIAELAQAVALAGLQRGARRRADEAGSAHARAQREHATASRGAVAARDECARLGDTAVGAEAGVAALGYDGVRHEHLDTLRDRATAIAALREAARHANTERLGAEAERERARAHTASTEEAARAAAAACGSREAARLLAEQTLRQAERAHAVARLRHEMQPGEACPVCEQAVVVVPAEPAEASLGGLEERCRVAVAGERAARQAETDARSQRAAALQALEHADGVVARARDDETEATATLADAVRTLWRDAGPHLPPTGSSGSGERPSSAAPRVPAAIVPERELVAIGAGSGAVRATRSRSARRESVPLPLFDVEPLVAPVEPAPRLGEGGAPEVQLLEALSLLGVLRQQHEAARAVLDQALRAVERARHESEKLGDRVAFLERSMADAARAHTEAEAGAAELAARITALGASDDPAAQREAMVQRRAALVAAQDAARDKERTAATARATLEAEARETQRRAAESALAKDAAQAAAAAAALESGFTEPAEARAAFLSLPEQERMARQVETHVQARSTCERRILEIGDEIGDALVDAATLAAAEQSWSAQRTEHHDGVRREATLDQRLRELRQRAEDAEKRARELAATRTRHALQKQLADDLRSDGFQAYLLEEAFRELVAGASLRLFELSNRYTFEFHRDAFHVLDHDNARERRSAETLSGGETFLASLALALELSQEVQRSAGAVHLESLFIDEGFGTLDPETLETIADAILALPKAGRMVGIITHIAELTERLPMSLQVAKRPEGSTVEIRRH